MLSGALESVIQGAKNSVWSATYRPADAIIFLTYRCTSQCAACNIWKRPVDPDEELSWDDWEPILNDLGESGLRSVELFGGDALLRKELLLNMVQFLTNRGIRTFFPTNSSSLTEKTVKDLVDAGLGTVYLSLDEVPEIGTSVRGVKRHFERAVRGIKLFRRFRGESVSPRISCITTVSSLNFRHLDQIADAAFDAGADEYMLRCMSEFTTDFVRKSDVRGIHPSPFFMPTNNQSHAFSAMQALECLSIVRSLSKRRSLYFPMIIDASNFLGLKEINLTSLTYPSQKCIFATTKVVVSPYGNVLPCLYFKNYHLGNLKTGSVKNAWGNSKHRRFCNDQQSNNIPLCEQCSIKSYHRPFWGSVRDAFRFVPIGQ